MAQFQSCRPEMYVLQQCSNVDPEMSYKNITSVWEHWKGNDSRNDEEEWKKGYEFRQKFHDDSDGHLNYVLTIYFIIIIPTK